MKVNMLRILRQRAHQFYPKLISPMQVAFASNGVMDDFFYLEIGPMYDLSKLCPVSSCPDTNRICITGSERQVKAEST